MKEILNSHPLKNLRLAVKNSNIKGYSKMNKSQLIDVMLKPQHRNDFKDVKIYVKPEKKREKKEKIFEKSSPKQEKKPEQKPEKKPEQKPEKKPEQKPRRKLVQVKKLSEKELKKYETVLVPNETFKNYILNQVRRY
tara:strand:- start:3191 stop:3601 length:411 start_codon:yes stop_codon:yes gene_type:complete